MIPMLTLGVPGDAVAAIMIGALTIQGLTPGPMLFKTNKVLVYTIFLGMFVANTIMVLLGFSCIRLFTKVLSVPKTILTPVIFILCVVGSYAMRSNFYDVGTMLIVPTPILSPPAVYISWGIPSSLITACPDHIPFLS